MSRRQEIIAEQRVQRLQEELRTAQNELQVLEKQVKDKQNEIANIDYQLDIAMSSSSY